MEMIAITVDDASRVGEARRAVLARAASLGWGEEDAGVGALLVTEAGTNLIKHAGRGTILFGMQADGAGLEILVLDRGPGLSRRSLLDGFSTTGSPGLGLGSLHRLATESDLVTGAQGTAIYMCYVPRGVATPRRAMAVGSLQVAKPPETVCGDAAAIHHLDGRTLFILCDGLGHGIAARDAAQAAIDGCRARLGHSLPDMINSAHAAARHTRGAAVLLVEIEHERKLLRACGVGNVSGHLTAGAKSVHLVSNNGTVGAEIRKVQAFTYPWDDGATLVMHSDGVQHRWTLDEYPGWRHRHPMLLAGLIYRDCGRGHDDASVIVARRPSPPEHP